MLRFDDLQLFVRAADLGSLSAAARVMDLSPAVASAALKRIEAQLGARLLARSTRSLRLTAEGEGFLEYARTALASLDEGRRLQGNGITGLLFGLGHAAHNANSKQEDCDEQANAHQFANG